jgi:histidine triad (HIT) family protein
VPDCLFCGIAAGDIAAAGVLESQRPVAFRVDFTVGPEADQTVPRAHAHVIGGRALAWPPG